MGSGGIFRRNLLSNDFWPQMDAFWKRSGKDSVVANQPVGAGRSFQFRPTARNETGNLVSTRSDKEVRIMRIHQLLRWLPYVLPAALVVGLLLGHVGPNVQWPPAVAP